jgi:threonine/homoserine/homoserine lactone efflux protein
LDIMSWFQVVLVCSMGAASPGPSLAVVLRNTMTGGRRHGVLTGLGHGLGIFLYAGLVVAGLAATISAFPALRAVLTYAGIALLVWLGLTFLGLRLPLREGKGTKGAATTRSPRGIADSAERSGFASGFLIAFLNPKIAAFFLAIFTPFIRAEAGGIEKTILAVTAGVIDAGWYVLVASVLCGTGLIQLLRHHAVTVERMIGVLLLVIAGGLLIG